MKTGRAERMMTMMLAGINVGVIGGADGPTAIFISAAPFWWVPFLIIAALIAAAVWGIIRMIRRRRR